ncbi:hypothetical protein E2F47_24860 [Mycobacterium eburneum]|nr:hypothetical protein [Mycobacterium eburneum]TDH48172.1 hypothetical protein E2F47_24860 [Mycobacterium eburneum]
MQLAARPFATAGIALAAAGLIAVTPAGPALAELPIPEIQLTGLDVGDFGTVVSGAVADMESLLGAGFGGTVVDAASGADPLSVASSFTAAIESAQIAFNQNLVDAELGFNNGLTGAELWIQQLLFGSDSALNGIINRGFNVFNMGVGVVENTVNAMLFGGALDRADDAFSAIFNGSLTLGFNGAAELLPNVFNSGLTAGFEGVFDQGLMVLLNTLGLLFGM